MAVVQVAFGAEAMPQPTLLTMFCVQTFWRDREKLVKGRFQQFASMEMALRAAKFEESRALGALVYRVRGSVLTQAWDEPVVLARFGEAREELPPPPAPGYR